VRVCDLSPEDKAIILRSVSETIFNNEDIRKILSNLSKLFKKEILTSNEYEKLRDTLEAILHGDTSHTIYEGHILSKDEASKELSLLPQKLANKEITSEEYRKIRDELEIILFD